MLSDLMLRLGWRFGPMRDRRQEGYSRQILLPFSIWDVLRALWVGIAGCVKMPYTQESGWALSEALDHSIIHSWASFPHVV